MELNLYRMVRNNPVTLADKEGLTPEDASPENQFDTESESGHYHAPPFDDIKEFFDSAVTAGVHARSKNKAPPIPVFKDVEQRDKFNMRARAQLTPKAILKNVYLRTRVKPNAFRAIADLERAVSPSNSPAWICKVSARPKVIIFAHGDAGKNHRFQEFNSYRNQNCGGGQRHVDKHGTAHRQPYCAEKLCERGAGQAYRSSKEEAEKHISEGTMSWR